METKGKCARGFSHHFGQDNFPWGIATSPRHPSGAVCTRLYDTVIFIEDLNLDIPRDVYEAVKEVYY